MGVFEACTKVAGRLKLYGVGQDLLAYAFSGNVKGMGPGVAEMEYTTLPQVMEKLRDRWEALGV